MKNGFNPLKAHVGVLGEMKHLIRSVIPADFSWRVRIDDDPLYLIQWRWLGKAGVTHWGEVSDADYSIAMHLLAEVSWYEERKTALASIENEEASILKWAQDKRRRELLSAAKPAKLALAPHPSAASEADAKQAEGVGRLPLKNSRPAPIKSLR